MNYQKIQSDFNEVIMYSQDYTLPINTDPLFKQWEKNKQFYFNCFNGELIYEDDSPLTIELDVKDREHQIESFLNWVYELYTNKNIYYFLQNNYDGLLTNKLIEPCDDFPVGTRLSKVLMKHFGTEAEPVRQKLSMLIQDNKVTGKLCLSVHPLDYLSASENTHKWRSCHALDGEYRSGNISYMADNVTIMAYLKTEDTNVKLPHFPDNVLWNNKKWRCYLFNDQHYKRIYTGRQYPFESEVIMRRVAQLLKKSHIISFMEDFYPSCLRGTHVINGMNIEFGETKIIVYDNNGAKIVPLSKFVETDKNALCYNDLLRNQSYAPLVLAYSGGEIGSRLEDHYNPPKMHVGADIKCLCCNKNNIADSDTFLCESCRNRNDEDEFYECDICGCIIENYEDAIVLHNGDYVCQNCCTSLDVHQCYCCNDHYSAANNEIRLIPINPPIASRFRLFSPQPHQEWVCYNCESSVEN